MILCSRGQNRHNSTRKPLRGSRGWRGYRIRYALGRNCFFVNVTHDLKIRVIWVFSAGKSALNYAKKEYKATHDLKNLRHLRIFRRKIRIELCQKRIQSRSRPKKSASSAYFPQENPRWIMPKEWYINNMAFLCAAIFFFYKAKNVGDAEHRRGFSTQ